MTRSLGKKTAPMLKFRHADTPRSAREFKRKYPTEFEALKEQTKGRDFTDEMLAELRSAYESPVEWTVVRERYDPNKAFDGLRFYLREMREAPDVDWVRERMRVLQGKGFLCEPSEVLLMCVRYEQLGLTEAQSRLLRAISASSDRSGHPHATYPLFCIGYVRYCDLGGSWVIEEVQTDLSGARRALGQEHMVRDLRQGGINPRDIHEVIDKLAPWEKRLYEDAIGVFLDMAAEAGVSVEMVDYSYKRDEESPQSVYSDLPRRMGMKLSDGSRSGKLSKSWKISPNSKKRRSSRRSR